MDDGAGGAPSARLAFAKLTKTSRRPTFRGMETRRLPGEVRDAVIGVLATRPRGASVAEIVAGVHDAIGDVPRSSVRSYLRLNTPRLFVRQSRGRYALKEASVGKTRTPLSGLARPEEDHTGRTHWPTHSCGQAVLYKADCLEWLASKEPNSVHAVVTDPPYGLVEYSAREQGKLRKRKGGVWRLPPSFDGATRSPLPRFTVLSRTDLDRLALFFERWARALNPVLVPGANVVVAANPLMSHLVAVSLAQAGLERRGEIVRLVTTMRGGDRPKGAHTEFSDVSVMPRSMWEPWLVFRKPLEGRVQDNLRKWGAGGFRRPSRAKPFGDVIRSSPTRAEERALAPHPSLKPQQFLRQVVRGVLPLAQGVVLDPFCGSGSTLAAADAVGYRSIGVERDARYFDLARDAIPRLARYRPTGEGRDSARDR